ncbi:MAG: hypothetical protein ACOC0A_01320 [Planctomycetota bacterium]
MMLKRELFSIAFILAVSLFVVPPADAQEELVFRSGGNNKFAKDYDGIATVPLSAGIDEGDIVGDGEEAATRYGTKKQSPVIVGTDGDQVSGLLLRFDLDSLEAIGDQIEGGRIVIPYKFASNNLPTMQIYEVASEEGKWDPESVSWQSFYGEEAADPDDATQTAQMIDEVQVAGSGGKLRRAEFEIPADVLSRWAEGDNAGLLLEIKDRDGAVKVETVHGATKPVLYVEGDWELDEEFYRTVEGSLQFYGSPIPRSRLIVSDHDGGKRKGDDGVLDEAFTEYNPNIEFKFERSFANKFHGACGLVMDGRGDLVFTGRQDWEWRATDEEKENLRYVPVAKQRVIRMGEEVGGVEYGVLIPKENPSVQAEAFVDFLGTSLAEEALMEPNFHQFVPRDAELVEFERPSYWSEKPWDDESPKMVHGMDLHVGEYASTQLTEMRKIMMKGYNSVLYGGAGSKNFMAWARENGMMLSSVPSTEENAEVAWGTFLVNEDCIGQKMQGLYRGEPASHGGKERQKDYKRALEEWPAWVKEKHGSLEKVNERWGTSYESWDEIGMSMEEYEEKIEGKDPSTFSWKDIGLPDPRLEDFSERYGIEKEAWLMSLRFGVQRTYYMAEHPELLDFYRFFRGAWGKYYEDRIEKIKEERPYLRENFRFATKSHANPYLHRSVDGFNSASWDHPVCKIPPIEVQVLVDTVQTPLGWPVWNSEDHLYNHGHSTPRRVRNVIFRNYLAGQFQSTSYCWWMNTRLGADKRHKAAVKVRNQIRRHEDVFRAFLDARANADIAVLATEGNRTWNEFNSRDGLPIQMDEPEEDLLGGAVKALAYVGALGRQWKYVLDEDVEEESVNDVLIIAAPWLRRMALEKISDLPDDRRIVVVGDFPTTDEYDQSLPEDQMRQLRDRAEHVETWDELHETVEPADGLGAPYTEVGEGKFWLWNGHAGRPRWHYYLPMARLELRQVEHDGNLYVAIINHADEEITASVPWTDGKEVNVLIDGNIEEKEDSDEYVFGGEAVALFEIR